MSDDLRVPNLIDYVDSCCSHGIPQKRDCAACIAEYESSANAEDLHSAGRCHLGDTPCVICGQSAEHTFGGE